MKSNKTFFPVKKVLRMINECQDQAQLNSCKVTVNQYIESVKRKGLANIEDLSDRLEEELLSRQEQLYLVNLLNKKGSGL